MIGDRRWYTAIPLAVLGLLFGLGESFATPLGVSSEICNAKSAPLSTLLDCGIGAWGRGERRKAERLLEAACRKAEDESPGEKEHLQALIHLARIAGERGNASAVMAVYKNAVKRLDEKLGFSDPAKIEVLLTAADAAILVQAVKDARKYSSRALGIAEFNAGDALGNSRLAYVLSRHAEFSELSGDKKGTAAALAQYVALYSWLPHPQLEGRPDRLARMWVDLGEPAKAASAYKLAIENRLTHYPSEEMIQSRLLHELTELAEASADPEILATAADVSELYPELAARDREGEIYYSWAIGVEPPVLLKKYAPTWPKHAEYRETEIVIRGVVQIDGTLTDLEVVECDPPGPLYEQSALNAVRAWHYKPATKDGVPVATHHDIYVDYKFRE